MNATSPWLLAVNSKLNAPGLTPIYETEYKAYALKVYLLEDSAWLVLQWPKGSRIAFRLAYSPGDVMDFRKITEKNNQVIFSFSCLLGEYTTVLQLLGPAAPVMRLTTRLKTAASVLF